MKIGVWVNGTISEHEGGAYTYIDTLIKGIDQYKFSSEIELIFISKHKLTSFAKPSIALSPLVKKKSFLIRTMRKLLTTISSRGFSKQIEYINNRQKKQ